MTGRREIEKLHETIAFSSDFYVSVFGWDVFNRLFAPWNLLVPAWTKLVYEHPGYMAWMTFEDMRNFLSRYRLSPGTYAFRMSCRSIGFWSVAYVDASGKVIQSVCRSQNFADFLEEGINRGKYVKPIGSQENTDLGELTKQVLTHRVTMHKLELYSSRESFMSCSICFDAPRTTRMEPCGHLFCAACTQSWLDRENCCPICRTQVIATSPVKIEFEGESEDDKRKLFITTMEKEGSWTSLNSCANSNRGSIPLPPTSEESNQKTLTVVTGRRSMELTTAPKENCEETPPLTIVLQNVPGPRETYRNSRSRTLPETIIYSRTDAMGDNTPATAFRRKSDQTNRSPRIITISDASTYYLADATENSTPATTSTGKPVQTNGSLKIISIKQIHKDSDEQDKIDHLTSAGWSEPDVRRALRVSNGDVVVAENILHEFVKQ
ncbi:hypothetical protein EG68_09414 [Paragonimus skrjabini miyazakii]|uniref:E3 ubiquitin-protein ligase CBL n=1 Tax=Paragonimus skrjabini miyazakii TaxID=59628 RepID=A0A8S9YMB4_9TREM|nr:hypothetical protein EG68_09414 [Paragonimus skrjabini miyazakii]